jgi:hypothetical protein
LHNPYCHVLEFVAFILHYLRKRLLATVRTIIPEVVIGILIVMQEKPTTPAVNPMIGKTSDGV